MPERPPTLRPDSGTQPSPHFTALLTLAPLGPGNAPCPSYPKGPSERVQLSDIPTATPSHSRFCTAMRWVIGERGVGVREGPGKGKVTKA